ncbi:hypothetical protein TNCV_2369541 [Trichonephila clavipes]|nr:hypothetical protein TNCV_2369541 [Trichonephila clavipes]
MAKTELISGTVNRAFQTQTGVSGTIPKTEPAAVVSLYVVERVRGEGAIQDECRGRGRGDIRTFTVERRKQHSHRLWFPEPFPKTEPAAAFSLSVVERGKERGCPIKRRGGRGDIRTFTVEKEAAFVR